ncbi:hypothetical protein AB1K32_16705 [Metabacillus dongyingensis]|uniref:hypothetical protein n=1 Tax=Metabacillus dongyingensis TaxID=2874282 RepID=UPI003B8B76C4
MLNPIWLIPFISTPIVLTITSYLAIDIGLVHPVVTNIPWVTPPIIGGYLTTGAHLSGAVMAGINLVISIAIYLPFVIMQERIDTKKIKEQTAADNNNLSV